MQEARAVSGAGGAAVTGVHQNAGEGRSLSQRHGEVPPTVPVLDHLRACPGDQPAVWEVGQDGVHLIRGQPHGDLCTTCDADFETWIEPTQRTRF